MGLGAYCERLFESHKLVRRLLVLWAVCLITWATLKLFEVPAEITGPAATAFGLVTGLLTAVIAHYQWARKNDDQSKEDKHHGTNF